MIIKSDWEEVLRECDNQTYRIRIDGGWLYKHVHQNLEAPESVAICFVPVNSECNIEE